VSVQFGIVVFPGTWSDTDCFHAVRDSLGEKAVYVWHKETDLTGIDCIILPGGFSYGDYLRPGAIARFSPVMASVESFAAQGKMIIGICNGFQVLCEAGLLPGILRKNQHLQFRCEWVNLRVESTETKFTNACRQRQVLQVPISHGDGNYYADEHTLERLQDENRIIFRYCSPEGSITSEANPNGSIDNIAGILNETGNILGMMPHPERAVEAALGGDHGLFLFQSILDSFLLPQT
jgi:phosphoribosylformylglycinamidine synthase I